MSSRRTRLSSFPREAAANGRVVITHKPSRFCVRAFDEVIDQAGTLDFRTRLLMQIANTGTRRTCTLDARVVASVWVFGLAIDQAGTLNYRIRHLTQIANTGTRPYWTHISLVASAYGLLARRSIEPTLSTTESDT